MPSSSFADTITDWDKAIASTENNLAELPHLAELRTQLIAARDGAKEANLRQSAFKAQQQQATRDREGFLERGGDLFTRLRNGVRMQYGLKGEKLAEFDMQPRRKPQKAKAEPTAPSTPPSETKQGAEPQKAEPQK
jgi:hypothetical protein